MSGSDRGFTLVELLVVLVIIASLVTMVVPRYLNSLEQSEEVTLISNLTSFREILDQYYADRGAYPSALQDLVDQGYIRSVPVDPITKRNDTWVLLEDRTPEEIGVWDIKSGAEGAARDGTPYSEL